MNIVRKDSFKILLLLLCVTFYFALCYQEVFAAASDTQVNLFSNDPAVLPMLYDKETRTVVTNETGDDITEDFLQNTEHLFIAGDFAGIKSYMADNSFDLHIIRDAAVPYAVERSKSVRSDYIYKCLYDSKFGSSLEVQGELVGMIWYNANKVTKVSATTFYVHEMTCSVFGSTPFNYGTTTGSSVKSGKGYFWARSSFGATASQDHVGVTYDYGQALFQFYATP